MNICTGRKPFVIIFFLFILCSMGCGSGGGDDGPAKPKVNMQGDWQGTIDWSNGNQWQINSLYLYQTKKSITDGNLQITNSNGSTINVEDVTGTVSGSTAEISAVSRSQDGTQEYELVMTGDVTESAFVGDAVITTSDNRKAEGVFSLNKTDDGDDPNDDDDDDDPTNQQRVEIEYDTCFTFATGTATSGSCTDGGDMHLWDMEDYADISSSEEIFCPQDGTVTSLDSISSDYSDCNWTCCMDGNTTMNPLDNTGYIVRDVSMTHHYKMRIIENSGGTLTFEYEQID